MFILCKGDGDTRHLQGEGSEGPGSGGRRTDRLHSLQEHIYERHQQQKGKTSRIYSILLILGRC
jgi:hypothetical protein